MTRMFNKILANTLFWKVVLSEVLTILKAKMRCRENIIDPTWQLRSTTTTSPCCNLSVNETVAASVVGANPD